MRNLPADRHAPRSCRHAPRSRAFLGPFVLAAAVLLASGCGWAPASDGGGSGHDGGISNGNDGGVADGGSPADGGAYDGGGWTSDGGAYDGGWVSDGGAYDGGWVNDGGGWTDGGAYDGGFYDGGFYDGGWTDGGLPGDGGAMGYACGDKTCSADQVCVKSEGGAVMIDGGANVSYTCDPYPLACQTVALCSCVGMAICHSTITDCSGPIPVVTCQYP